jgi:hypothetical protein
LDISDVLPWSVTVFINSAARALYWSGCYVKHLQILHFVTLQSNKSAHKFEYEQDVLYCSCLGKQKVGTATRNQEMGVAKKPAGDPRRLNGSRHFYGRSAAVATAACLLFTGYMFIAELWRQHFGTSKLKQE